MFLTTEEALLRVGESILSTITPAGAGLYWEVDIVKVQKKRVRKYGECSYILHPGYDQMSLPDDWPKTIPWTYCKSPVAHGSYCQEHWETTHRGIAHIHVPRVEFRPFPKGGSGITLSSEEAQHRADKELFRRLGSR